MLIEIFVILSVLSVITVLFLKLKNSFSVRPNKPSKQVVTRRPSTVRYREKFTGGSNNTNNPTPIYMSSLGESSPESPTAKKNAVINDYQTDHGRFGGGGSSGYWSSSSSSNASGSSYSNSSDCGSSSSSDSSSSSSSCD